MKHENKGHVNKGSLGLTFGKFMHSLDFFFCLLRWNNVRFSNVTKKASNPHGFSNVELFCLAASFWRTWHVNKIESTLLCLNKRHPLCVALVNQRERGYACIFSRARAHNWHSDAHAHAIGLFRSDSLSFASLDHMASYGATDYSMPCRGHWIYCWKVGEWDGVHACARRWMDAWAALVNGCLAVHRFL